MLQEKPPALQRTSSSSKHEKFLQFVLLLEAIWVFLDPVRKPEQIGSSLPVKPDAKYE